MEADMIASVVLMLVFQWIILAYLGNKSKTAKQRWMVMITTLISFTLMVCVLYFVTEYGYMEGQKDMLKGRQKVYPVVKELNGIPTDTIYVKIK